MNICTRNITKPLDICYDNRYDVYRKMRSDVMTYVMEKELIEKINAQRAEAIEFSKQPGCWMGMYVEPSDTKYWSGRVPSGTLKEFNRIELEEDAYYAVADAYSKSYARSFDFASMTDAEIEKIFDDALCRNGT